LEKPCRNKLFSSRYFDVDEIVRRLGGCPDDDDYTIVRSYYYWEWLGNEDWITIATTKEDYEKYKDNDEFEYRAELNYDDFLDKFWFDSFQQSFYEYAEPNEQLYFITYVNDTFFTLSFEGQGKLFLRNMIKKLNHWSAELSQKKPKVLIISVLGFLFCKVGQLFCFLSLIHTI
jgi:hypothetical protein